MDFLFYVLIGFAAQIVDGALGMAYGVTSTTLLLSIGLSPLTASSTTHAAEFFTTGFSAIAHHQLGNVDRYTIIRLIVPGMAGAMLGAFALIFVDGDIIKPFMAFYLMLMGIVILVKFFSEFPPARTLTHHLIPLGFVGGFMDVIGGGGWGAIVTSTLLARGSDVRMTIGSVNICEFFVVLMASSIFFLSGSIAGWNIILGLALGGALAAPLGAWLCKHMPSRWLLLIVGFLIIFLSLRTFWLTLT